MYNPNMTPAMRIVSTILWLGVATGTAIAVLAGCGTTTPQNNVVSKPPPSCAVWQPGCPVPGMNASAVASAADNAENTPPPAAPTTPAPPPPPQYTVSQQSAIQDAESYIQTEPGFSYEGLIGQVEFDQFSAADATFAVNHIQVDWNQQAADDAHSYMQNEGGFSCGSLLGQLEFDKFTPSQAEFGVQSVGLGQC